MSTGITGGSQSLGSLPVTPTPDPGSSGEKKNPPGTDQFCTNK